MCLLPCEYMASSSDTCDSEEEENHNTWNMLLELLTLPGSSPSIKQGLFDCELCSVALSCHFALEIIHTYIYIYICILWPWSDEQGESDCDTPKHRVRAACYVYVKLTARQR